MLLECTKAVQIVICRVMGADRHCLLEWNDAVRSGKIGSIQHFSYFVLVPIVHIPGFMVYMLYFMCIKFLVIQEKEIKAKKAPAAKGGRSSHKA